MVELWTLGRVALAGSAVQADDDGADAPALQRKALALLVYLAVTGEELCRRDTLVDVFWPQRDSARARNALSKSLGRIRDMVGRGVTRTVGAHEVGVARGGIRVDIVCFDKSVAAGELETALHLYAGPFLPGFGIPGAPRFDRWVESVRARAQLSATRAALELAARQESSGAVGAAVDVLQRAAGWAPTDERIARALMTLLARDGSNAAALAEYARLEHALHGDLDMRPTADTRSLAASVRAHQALRDPRAPRGGAGAAPVIDGIAVLPFANLTGDPTRDYLADGVTDALITSLARSLDARVISRQSVRLYRDSNRPLHEIAGALGVDAFVEGSLSGDANRVRVTAQLVSVHPKRHLWADTFERPLDDIEALSADIAQRIGRAIHEPMTPAARGASAGSGSPAPAAHAADRAPRPVDPAAYEAYLKGRHFSLRAPEIHRAVAYFQQAIEKDAAYGPAWTGLASVYAQLTLLAYLSPADSFPPFQRAARRALELDRGSGEARALAGLYRMLADRDWRGAEEDLRAAAAASPELPEVHAYHAFFLGAMGWFGEAFEEAKRATALDPVGATTRFTLAWCEYRARRFTDALATLHTILELHPHFALAYPYVAVLNALLGNDAPAAAASRLAVEALPEDPATLALAAAAFGRCGAAVEAEQALSRLLGLAEHRYLDPWSAGTACAALGREDEAVRWFRRMYDERSPSAFCIKEDPLLDPIRAHAGFQEIVRRLAFPAKPAYLAHPA